MGFIIDTPDNLRLGLELRRESFSIIANGWAQEDGEHMWISATVTDRKSSQRSASIELELDQIGPLIEGLRRLQAQAIAAGAIPAIEAAARATKPGE